jgi:hypothetical protein
MDTFDEKTRAVKSRATVPLSKTVKHYEILKTGRFLFSWKPLKV